MDGVCRAGAFVPHNDFSELPVTVAFDRAARDAVVACLCVGSAAAAVVVVAAAALLLLLLLLLLPAYFASWCCQW